MIAEKSTRTDIYVRTKGFALQIVKLYSSLPKTLEAQVIGKQALRSGTSVGAQVHEGKRSRSGAELISKVESALQELEETGYWLELLETAGIAGPEQLSGLMSECNELTAMLVSSAKTLKRKASFSPSLHPLPARQAMDGVVHFEIPATDMERAKAFYKEVFDWKANQFSPDYCIVETQPVDENRMPLKPGMINGALQLRSPQITMPRIAIYVENIDLKVKTIEQNGGKVLQPKTEVPGMLYYAVIQDTEGNEVGLVQPLGKM